MLAWDPHVGDLAAQVFRTELFQRAGLGIWNGSWYGGHYTLTYSVLFPPLAALLGPRLVGTLAVVASSYLFDRLVRDRWGEAARWATLWFAAGVVTLLADGQLTFALGVAFGLASVRAAAARPHPAGARGVGGLRALQPGRGGLPRRRPPRGALARASSHRLIPRVRGGGRGPPAPTDPRVGGGPGPPRSPSALTLIPNLAFPEGGQFPFAFSSYVAIPLFCAGALIVTRGLAREERQLRRVLLAYAPGRDRALAGAQPAGRQRGAARRAVRRPGAGRGRARPPAAPRRAAGAGARDHARRRPLLAGDRERQPDRPHGRRPLDQRRLLRPGVRLAARPRRRARRGSRCRRPPTTGSPPTWRRASNWRAAGCASSTRRATTSSTTTTSRSTRATYRAWLHDERDPLRRPARRAARLLLGRRAPPDPQRARPTSRRAGATPTGASTKCATRRRWSSRSAPARPPSARSATAASPSTSPAPASSSSASPSPPTGRSPRPRLPAPPRRVDRGPRQPSRRLPRRRRLLARPRLERGNRRPQDLLTPLPRGEVSRSGSNLTSVCPQR